MPDEPSNHAPAMRALPVAAAIALILCTLHLSSCSGDDDKVYAANVDPERTPTMTTSNVSTLISDSGITRYKVEAPIWYVYDEAKDPRWSFPQTLHLERFDNFFNKEATVDCDSATYFKNRQLWRLDGNVRVLNLAGEKFLTQQLFWDQRKQSVYSDSFIQIIRSDRIMEGYGFVSNETMTDFSVSNVSAILPVDRNTSQTQTPDSAATGSEPAAADTAAVNSAPADSVAPRSPRRPQRPRKNIQPNQ